jgi:hypothetical protein
MKNRDNIYNVGNDYFQKLDKYFLDTDEKVSAATDPKGNPLYGKAYSDGLYHYTTEPVYELSGGASALNKRVFNKLPQSAWTAPTFITDGTVEASAFSGITDASAVFSPDYAKVEFDFETDNTWSGTPKAKED